MEAGAETGALERYRKTSADTREPDGPDPRLYAAPFSQVWDELLRHVNRRLRWKLAHRDEDLGHISVRCSPLPGVVHDLVIWVALDANGLTRVDALSRTRKWNFDLGMNRRRIERMFRWLDRRLRGTRIIG